MSGGTADSASYAYTASSATNAFNSISASYAYTASSAINAFSASYAISSSYAATASFANSFNVAGNLTASNAVLSGTLTAQTLVVQTITSSIDFVTGSTRFGSLLTNTHTFTGSIYQTGSIAAFAGSVGIGTTNPATKFDLSGTIGNFQIASSGAEIFLTRNENNDILATGGTSSGITLGAQSFLRFKVGTSYTERMVINSTGDVGIGTTNPSNKLTIRGTDSTSMLYLGISGASANGEAVGITFGSATYDKARIVAYNENSGNAAGYLTLWTGGSPTTTDITERMRITSAGKVGIGITTPAEVLEVSGSLKIGNLKIQNVNGGSIGFNRNTADGAIYNPGYAAFQINGALSGTNYLDFQNYSSSGSYLGSFVFKDGNLGVGITNPLTKLQVLGPTLTVGDQSTYALGIGNSSGYDLTLATGTSYAYIQSWTSKPLSLNSQGNNVIFPNGATNVGIGTTNPFSVLDVRQPYAKTDTTRRDILYASNDSTPAGLRISITGGASQGVRSAHLQTTEWGVTNDGIMSLQPFGGKVGIGVTNPSKLFEVNGRMATSATVSTNLIAGNIASNMPSSPAYIPIFNLAEAAGMSLVGFVNAASYTCFNISQIYIKKEYSGTGITAGITGLYKSACDFSIVNITYSGVTYVALRFTSNPEIDVMWTGYLLNYAFNGDGSAQVWTSGVTLNSTYASY
jgi:hypothetical protein